jgi:hypothetical protein
MKPEPHDADVRPRCTCDDHPIVRAVVRRDEGVELLRVIQIEMAKAAAELRFLDDHRDEFEADELLERGRAITRQVRALRRLVELECSRIRRFGRPPLRLDDPMVRRAFGLLVERIVEVGHEVLPEGKADELEVKFRERLAAEPQVPWP